MAEKIVSPGVFTREIDLSFLPKQVQAIGSAIVGPTPRGPALVPTPVSTYADYLRIFGDSFSSGSGTDEVENKYLTSYAAQEYLRYGEVTHVVRTLAGSYAAAKANVVAADDIGAGDDTTAAFIIHTRTEGEIMNNGTSAASTAGQGASADEGTGGRLNDGSRFNIRWEINNVNTNRGTFNLLIRRGDDIAKRRVILEQFNGVSLDPNSSNYVGRVVGDQTHTLRYDAGGEPYLQLSGSYKNRSRYIRVEVKKNTLNYLDGNGDVRDAALSGSLPAEVSGTFAFGDDGTVEHPRNMYENISNTNTQGFNVTSGQDGETAYLDAIALLGNADDYDINLLVLPGLVDGFEDHAKIYTRAIAMVEARGDVFLIIDPTGYGSTVGQAVISAEARNTSYAAMYYPWIQIPDADLGKNVWLPPSALLPGVITFNDKVAAPWYAPAGLNRGTLDVVLQAEKKLTQNDRDVLYESSVNPLATFPNQGVCVWGQKTLQKKASALDRVNVRRLLIAAKKFVASTTKYLVFEQNTEATRTRFLQITEPFFEDARRRQGLYAFRIVMDESNNTPDVVDRNEMRGVIYMQPAKTAEFIIVDFTVLPTGAKFPGDVGEE
jgi:hypothetical protein